MIQAQSLSTGGMHVKWDISNDHIEFEMTSPLKGWIAIGINDKDDIVGANLIMASIRNKQLIIEDQFVTSPGEHKSVESLGGKSAISNYEGFESDGKTTIRFRLKLAALDKFHYDLEKGKEIVIICAYSESDDFGHHSRIRKHFKITL